MRITLDRQESIEILEDIARNSENAAARIAALKELDRLRAAEEIPAGFEGLYAVGPRRQQDN